MTYYLWQQRLSHLRRGRKCPQTGQRQLICLEILNEQICHVNMGLVFYGHPPLIIESISRSSGICNACGGTSPPLPFICALIFRHQRRLKPVGMLYRHPSLYYDVDICFPDPFTLVFSAIVMPPISIVGIVVIDILKHQKRLHCKWRNGKLKSTFMCLRVFTVIINKIPECG